MDRFVKLKNLTSIGIADVLGNGITAIFWFYIASVLEPEKYGEISYILGLTTIVSAIALFGTQYTITVYTAKNVKIQSTFIFISLLIGAISSLVLIVFFYRIDASLLLVGYIINTLVIGELLGRKLYLKFSKYFLTQKILTLIVGISFYYIFSADGIIFALALSYIGYSFRVFTILKKIKINFNLLKPRLGFITNNYLINLIAATNGQIDKLIIVPILGFTILGNYALALQVISVLLLVPNIVFKYILPEDASGNKNKKIKKMTIISSIGLAIFGITMIPLIIPFLFPKYLEVISAIQIVSFNVIPVTLIHIYTSKFLAIEKSKFILINRIIMISVLTIGMIILGSSYGIIGVSIALVLSSTISAIFLTFVDRVIIRM